MLAIKVIPMIFVPIKTPKFMVAAIRKIYEHFSQVFINFYEFLIKI